MVFKDGAGDPGSTRSWGGWEPRFSGDATTTSEGHACGEAPWEEGCPGPLLSHVRDPPEESPLPGGSDHLKCPPHWPPRPPASPNT